MKKIRGLCACLLAGASVWSGDRGYVFAAVVCAIGAVCVVVW